MAKAVVKDGMVQMLDQSGAPVQVPQASLEQAYQSGWTIEDPAAHQARQAQIAEGQRRAEQDTLGAEALTVAEGAASGLTFGISDHLLVQALGDEYREKAKLRKEVNPLASTAGEIAGTLAPALLTGGGSVAARAALAPGRAIAGLGAAAEGAAARVLGGGMASKIAGGALSGAVENTAFGLGRLNADAALGGTEITADKLLSTVGEGILWGAAGGGIIAGGTQAIGKAGNYAAEKMLGEGATLRSAMQDWAANRAIKGVTSEALPVTTEQATRLGKRLVDNGIPTHDPTAAVAAVKAAAAKSDEVLNRVAKLADNAQVRPATAEIFTKADDAARRLRDVPTAEFQAAAKAVDDHIAPLLDKATRPGATPATVSDLLSVRQSLAKLPAEGPAGEATAQVRKAIDDAISETFDRTGSDALHAAAAAGDTMAEGLLRDQRGAKDALRQALEDADDWGLLSTAAQRNPSAGMKEKLQSVGQSSILGVLTGIATGSVTGGAVVSFLGSKAGAVAKEYALQRGMGTLMKMADRIAKVDSSIEGAAAAIATGSDRGLSAATQGNTGGLLPGFYMRLREQVEAAERGESGAWVSQEIAAEHPEVAEAINQRVLDDAAYLRKLFPMAFAPSDSALRPASAEDMPVSDVEMRKLRRVAEAINNPLGPAADLARGHYDPDAWKAIKARRPELYQDLRTKVMSDVMVKDKPVPYARRVMLGLAFDFPADWSLRPANVAAIQAVSPPAPAPDSPEGSPNANISKLAEAYALPSNPIEAPP